MTEMKVGTTEKIFKEMKINMELNVLHVLECNVEWTNWTKLILNSKYSYIKIFKLFVRLDISWTCDKLNRICRFGQMVRCVGQNKELTPKGEDVKLITWQKHVPNTIGWYFLTFFLGFLDESSVIFYVKIIQIKRTKNGTPFLKFCINF